MQNLQTKVFVRMCLMYQITRSDPSRLQWITVGVVGKHDDATGHRTGNDQTQAHLVDKQRPELDRKIDKVRKKSLFHSFKHWIKKTDLNMRKFD